MFKKISKLQKYPRLFHIGTQKAGSTYLYNLLQQHPEVCLSKLTEINFFSNDFNKGFNYYRDLFIGEGVSIDMTPKYFMLGKMVAPRIREYSDKYLDGEPRFLLILRNPIDYLNSHYEMQKIQAPKLGDDDKNKYSLVEYIKRNPGYLNRAKYFEILSIWLQYFKMENFKIICFEDFVANKEKIFKEILQFWTLKDVALDDRNISKNRLLRYAWLHRARTVINKSKGLKNILKNSRIFSFVFDRFLTKRSGSGLSGEDRLVIGGMLKDDIVNLKKITNNNFSLWGDFEN